MAQGGQKKGVRLRRGTGGLGRLCGSGTEVGQMGQAGQEGETVQAGQVGQVSQLGLVGQDGQMGEGGWFWANEANT